MMQGFPIFDDDQREHNLQSNARIGTAAENHVSNETRCDDSG